MPRPQRALRRALGGQISPPSRGWRGHGRGCGDPQGAAGELACLKAEGGGSLGREQGPLVLKDLDENLRQSERKVRRNAGQRPEVGSAES